MDDVKIDLGDAIEEITRIEREKYATEQGMKQFIVLQNIESKGQVWNATTVTKAFKTLNIKIDSKTGEVIEEKLVSLMQNP